MRDKLRFQLIEEEGLELFPYLDTVGKWTIGVGRNLTDVGISKSEAMVLLSNDIAKVESALRANLSFFNDLDEVRQDVLLDMAFNMGLHGLLQFNHTLACVSAGEYERAADAMLQSKWATQVKGRATKLAEMMRTGSR